mgnify:CR=1 FL=1
MLDYCYFVAFILQKQNESKNEIHDDQEHDAFFGTSVLLIIISLTDTRLDLILWFCFRYYFNETFLGLFCVLNSFLDIVIDTIKQCSLIYNQLI